MICGLAMSCPACGNPTGPSDWICSFCDHILDPSVLETVTQANIDEEAAREERTHLVAWEDLSSEDSIPEAVMLGDVSVAEDEFGVVHGAGSDDEGNTSTFLYYTSGSTTRVVHPDAVPRIAIDDVTLPRTPYEDFILSCIDGERSVREIQKTSGLAPQEVVVTLLTLLDKGAVDIETTTGEDMRAPERKRTSRVRPKATRRRSAPERPTSIRPLRKDVTDTTEALSAQDRPKFNGPLPDDFDDLPSVSDFEEIVEEIEATDAPPRKKSRVRSRAKSRRPAGREVSSLSDVWATSSNDAQSFRPLSDADSEEVTKAATVPKKPKPKPKPKRKKSAKKRKKSTKKRKETPIPVIVASPRKPPPLPPPDPSEVVRRETAEELAVALEELEGAEPPDPTPLPAPMLLDPSFLTEVPGSEPALVLPAEDDESSSPIVAPLQPSAPHIGPDADAKAKRKAALAAALKRGPIQERDRRRAAAPARKRTSPPRTPTPPAPDDTIPPPPSPPPSPAPEPEVAATKPPSEPIDNARMLKAQKLFDQALKDKSEGNLVSARMNMKLSLTFDPTNELYKQAFDDLSKNPEAVPGGTPQGRTRARELYDQATEAENNGNVDRAIELLERALSESKQAAFLNRLGVILATKKGEYERAQRLIEEALELTPGNGLYEKNLSKVLSKAATSELRKERGEKKGGLLGFLGRRK